MRSAPSTLCLAVLLAGGACGGDPFAGARAARSSALASGRPGMGATFYGGGTAFRVWAPSADRVFVAGDWNSWSADRDELTAEGNGNFSADLEGARPGHRYKYVVRHGGDVLYRADPRARRMENSLGASIIVDPGAYHFRDGGFGTPPFQEQILYELHVGTFYDSPGGGPGNFQSAEAKLDHLRDLGVTMLELMPPAEFPGDFSAGYNPAYPFAPESAYGPPEALKHLIDEAHLRGLGVIIDVVHNHYGPNDLSMWCFDGECYGAGGAYFYTDWRRETGWGPRPDYGRQPVRDFIRDNALMWLREYHADGLRWDSTYTMRGHGGADLPDGWAVLQTVNSSVDAEQPWKIMIAEDFRGNSAITRQTAWGGAGFDSQWDGEFFHPISNAIITREDRDRSMAAVAGAIRHGFNDQATQRVIYTESHDEVSNGRQRVPEMIWPGNAGSFFSKKRSTLGAAIALTSPGIPMLFQGQEFLEDGWFSDGRPLDWGKATRYAGIVSLYRDLIRLRRNWFNNTRGLRGEHVNVFHVNDGDKVIAYHRWDRGGPGDDVVVVANFSGRAFPAYTIGLPRRGTWYLRLNSDWSGYSPDFWNTHGYDAVASGGARDGLGASGDVGVGPYSVVIYSQ